MASFKRPFVCSYCGHKMRWFGSRCSYCHYPRPAWKRGSTYVLAAAGLVTVLLLALAAS